MTQLEAGKAVFDLAGYVSFLLWRSVYVTKQVSIPPCICINISLCHILRAERRGMHGRV